jgi:hypothetical protein
MIEVVDGVRDHYRIEGLLGILAAASEAASTKTRIHMENR